MADWFYYQPDTATPAQKSGGNGILREGRELHMAKSKRKPKTVSVEVSKEDLRALKMAGKALTECAGAYITASDNSGK
jgi:hypothetical protein